MPPPAPVPLGLRRSFGFDDRLGLAAPGHLAAARRFSIAPVLVQLAPREFVRSGTTPAERIARAGQAVAAAHFPREWGADAHTVKTDADVESMAAAGVTWFTLDPSAFVENRADALDADGLAEELAVLGKEGVLPAECVPALAGRRFELGADIRIACELDALARAAVKFARALHHAQRLARHVSTLSRPAPCDIELALVECTAPATPAEHLFIALEMRRRAMPVTSLALRWDAGLEPAVEFAGDAEACVRRLRIHAAIARALGPYKVSVHHGDAKYAILAGIARACGEHLHVKSGSASHLAAMRLVCRAAPDLFREIVAFARPRFESERVPHLVSTTRASVERLFRPAALATPEATFLDTAPGQHLLQTTSAAVLSQGLTSRGRPFRDAILDVVLRRKDDYRELLDTLFTRHLELLNQG